MSEHKIDSQETRLLSDLIRYQSCTAVNSGWHGTWLETSVLAAILGDTCKAYSHSFSFAYAQSGRATGNLFLTASKLELLLVATFL